MTNSTTVLDRLARLQASIKNAAASGGRSGEPVQCLFVTKTIAAGRVREVYDQGVRDFGENRVQELLSKKKELPSDIRWHLIGHLQTNKVKQVMGEVILIHSLDRWDLAQEIKRQASKKNISEVRCLIQVKTSSEPTKYGVAPEEVLDFAGSLNDSSPLKLQGLMTIAPFTKDENEIRESFRELKHLQVKLKQSQIQGSWDILSMGMSHDYLIAIEEGATMIRIGSAVFGQRPAEA